MSADHRRISYEGEANHPDHVGSWNRTQGYSNTQDYPHFPGPLTSPSHSSTSNNPYLSDSRTHSDYPRFVEEPPYPSSPSNSDYPGSRNNRYPADSRRADHHTALPEPDYIDRQSNPHHPASSREPDYPGSHPNPDFAGFRGSRNYASSRTNPGYLGDLGEPDYPGAQESSNNLGPRLNSNHLGSRRNPDYAGSRINPLTDSLGEPDYPGAENHPNSPHFGRRPDYLGAKDPQNSLNFSGEPDYPGAEDTHGYGSSKTSGKTRGDKCHPLGILGKNNEDDTKSIGMVSMEMANLDGRCVPGTPANGCVNPAYVGEIHPDHAHGSLQLSECDWHKSPQGQKLIASLIPMTPRDRIKTIRNQPRTMEEKRKLRNIVDQESKQSRRTLEVNCCAQCLNSLSLAYRRSRSSLAELLDSGTLWQRRLKVIGGKFGTSVLLYFSFLRWLLKFNVFAFVVNFSFLVVPQLTVAEGNDARFTGLELLTGAGYFRHTVMFYGFYTNSTIQHRTSGASYNMQLAYLLTIGACLTTCFFSLLFSMAKYFRDNFIKPHIYSRGIAKLVFCWDFTVTHGKAVKLKQKNLSTEIRENLSEIRQENAKLTFHQQLTCFLAHVAAWVVSTGVAVACCAAVYYLAEYNSEFLKTHTDPGSVLLLPFLMSCINLVVPRFYSMFRLVEKFETPRHEVYVLLIRNVFLKISIIGILCYYWLNIVAVSEEECWETFIGQEIYRLLLMEFLFSLADSLLGDFVRRIIGMKFITSLGLQEFDIARNVLELIYAQTLVWLGTFFCPLLPLIQMITLFIMFYVKNVSLMMNFQPPSKAWRASQMMTVFIFLLFFPSFTGVLCTLAIIIWRLKPSAHCGPFRGLPSSIQSIYSWIDTLRRPGYLWVVWIYQNLIGSVHFFFTLTLIVLIITYLYWKITEGRKIMVRLLHEQIINEGKDKMFLIEKLAKLQNVEQRANPREVEQQSPLYLREQDAASDVRFRRSVQEGNPKARSLQPDTNQITKDKREEFL